MTNNTQGRRTLSAALGRLYLCGALGSLVALAPASARAQAVDDATRNAARRLAESGVESYQHGDYEKAVDQLNRAYSLLRVPTIGVWSARALASSAG